MSGRHRHGARRWHDPAALLRHLGVIRPADIDVEAIARYCNARVSYQPLRGCEDRLVGHRGRAVIVVSRNVHPYRRRFTIAHELGHWMFDRADVAHVFTEATWGEDPVRAPSTHDSFVTAPPRHDGSVRLPPTRHPEAPPPPDGPLQESYEDRPEQRANRWTAELLMPEGLFAPDAADREISFDTVRDLARRGAPASPPPPCA